MSGPAGILERGDAIRRNTIAILDGLAEKAQAFELPPPPEMAQDYRRKLAENTYTVLVAGEAKRGKSTFVNALIGRDLLPTDVDIATGQVFRVRRAEHGAYRLRFEDGSQREIAAADLARYGSQVAADRGEAPRLDQIIRWIEVDAPVRFLPPGVALLDTPGLGSLYAAHAQITQRFVPHADAVIVALDSGQPIGQEELQFVEAILGVTRSIFFIQTKIDQHRREHWEEIQHRNQELLRQRLGDRLADARVWPISSTNLMKAAKTGDEDYVMVSRHKELAAALHAFLARVAGWGRSAEALAIAEQYHAAQRLTLEGRLAALAPDDETKRKRAELQRRKQQFDAEWGARGQRRLDLVAGVRRATTLGRHDFQQALQPGGGIAAAAEARIDAVGSLDAARQVGQVLSESLVAAAVSRWRQICSEVQSDCVELLAPFVQAADAVRFPVETHEPVIPVGGVPPPTIESAGFARVKAGSFDVGVIGSLTAPVLGLLASTLFAPLAVAVAAGAAVWAYTHGYRGAELRQLEAARQELRKHLNTVLRRVHGHFFNVDQSAGRFSLVEEYFTALEQAAADLVQRRAEEIQAEIARVAEAASLDDRQRRARGEQVQQQVAAWAGIGRSIAAAKQELKVLEQPAWAPATDTGARRT